MRKTLLAAMTVLAVAAIVGQPVSAQTCPRECTIPEFSCPDAATTVSSLQIGGEGAVFTEHDCAEPEPGDIELEPVEADLQFSYTRGCPDNADPCECGRLTVTVVNQTCTPTESKITQIWFNAPDDVADGEMISGAITGKGDPGWDVDEDPGGAGCFGGLDWAIGRGGGNLQSTSIEAGETGTFVIEFTGTGMCALTACDFAAGSSETNETGHVSTHAVIHFQNTDPPEPGSEKTSSNCTPPQFVELASFTATPGDRSVLVEWTTALELDNAGFYVVRRNTLTGERTRLNQGLIPAQGDVFMGASYSFLDTTATNGVKYEYLLVDVDVRGVEGWRKGVTAVANPLRPPVRLVAPAYEDNSLRLGQTARFRFEASGSGNRQLVISADPTFADAARTMVVNLGSFGRRSGEVSLTPSQRRSMESIATSNFGVVYWTVIQKGVHGAAKTSETFVRGYATLEGSSDTTSTPVRGGRRMIRD